MSERRKIKIRTTISIILCTLIIGMIACLFFKAIPATNKDAFNILLGGVTGSFITMISYWFGDSHGGGV